MVFAECEEMTCDRESARYFGNAFDVGNICRGGELGGLGYIMARMGKIRT